MVYHIVDIEWFKKWQIYTGYHKIKDEETPGGPYSSDTRSMTTNEDDSSICNDDISKLSIHQSKET